jgi:hypothetical protein
VLRSPVWRRIKYVLFVVLVLALVNVPMLLATSSGEHPSTTMVLITFLLDTAFLLFVVAVWRFGRYGAAETLRLEALGPVRAATEPRGIDEVDEDGEVVVVRGDVLSADEHEIVLDVDGRTVVVILDGHDNPIGRGRVAHARGRRLRS